ncbi:MAG: ATP cone domain-containing protein, partial [Gammaproteobacteria bacterium]
MLNVATESAASAPLPPMEPVETAATDSRYADYKLIRRNGAVVGFAPGKIAIAVTKAFIAVQGGQAAASARIRELVEAITAQVTQALIRRQPNGGTFHIEDVQDQVELALMRSGEHEVARAYVLYREKRAQERAAAKAAGVPDAVLHVVEDGVKKPLDTARLAGLLADACAGLGDNVKAEPIMQTVLRDLYDGVP